MGKIADSTRRLRSKKHQKALKGSVLGGGKAGRNVINMAERARIEQRAFIGQSASKIARETGHTRRSVAKIIAESDIPKYVEKVRGQFVGLGTLAVTTLEKEMRAGNWQLAYRFLKDSGVLADIEGRAALISVATGKPAQTVGFEPSTRDMLLASLSEPDKRTFRVLETIREKALAYGMPSFDESVPGEDSPIANVPYAPAEQTPEARKSS